MGRRPRGTCRPPVRQPGGGQRAGRPGPDSGSRGPGSTEGAEGGFGAQSACCPSRGGVSAGQAGVSALSAGGQLLRSKRGHRGRLRPHNPSASQLPLRLRTVRPRPANPPRSPDPPRRPQPPHPRPRPPGKDTRTRGAGAQRAQTLLPPGRVRLRRPSPTAAPGRRPPPAAARAPAGCGSGRGGAPRRPPRPAGRRRGLRAGPRAPPPPPAPATTFWLALPGPAHPVPLAPGAGTAEGQGRGRGRLPALPSLCCPLRHGLAGLPHPQEGCGSRRHPAAGTHLEPRLRGDEEHLEGLPTLEGKAAAALLLAPAPALLGVEDHRGLVHPGVEVQSSLGALLLPAQQVHVKPGESGGGR